MQPRDNRATLRRRADYRPPAFLVDRIALEFDLDPDATRVTSLKLEVKGQANGSGSMVIHIGLRVSGRPRGDARLNGRPVISN